MRYALIALVLLLSNTHLNAQATDTLVKISGTRVGAIIKEVSAYEVIYNVPGRERQKPRHLSKSTIARIEYADGRRDTFFVMNGKQVTKMTPLIPREDLFKLGARDAKAYYTRFSGASTGTLLATFPGSPAVGLITAIATSATMPQQKNLGYPNQALMNYPDYREGYERKAWSIKRTKVWAGWGIGVGLTAAFIFLLESVKSAH